MYKIDGGGGGGQRVKKGCHKIGAWAEIGQNRIRGEGGVRKTQKMWDIIYARSLSAFKLSIKELLNKEQTGVKELFIP